MGNVILNLGKFRLTKRCIIQLSFIVLFQDILKILPKLILRLNVRAIRPLGFFPAELINQPTLNNGF